ncbi:hypothetical protein DFH09DRAFT_1271038 [Mycena vulgaris]|nr:hypothetical protein DFH09DRAFT_1271038 [Mycena vulgaris]
MPPPPNKARSIQRAVLAAADDDDDPFLVVAVPLDPDVRTHKPTTTTHHHHIPPRYSQGSDGLWRRVDSYTLVGSTVCDTCTALPTQSAGTDDEFLANMPPGWMRDKITSSTRTNLTVGLTLAISCLIVITIIRCHFYRSKPRRRGERHYEGEEPDVEKRRSRRERERPVSVSQEEKEKPKVRKWMAKATARWRDNARYLARQRRGRHRHHSRRGSVESLVDPTTSASASGLETAPGSSSHPRPRSRSRSPSPSPSTRTLASASSSSLALEDTPQTPPPALTPLALAEPPAYPSPSPSPPASNPNSTRNITSNGNPNLIPSHPGSSKGAATDADEPEAHPPYTPHAQPQPYDSASYFDFDFDAPPSDADPAAYHLATDDKALLARLAAGASAPSLSSPPSHSTLASAFSFEEARAPAEEEVWAFEGEAAEDVSTGASTRASASTSSAASLTAAGSALTPAALSAPSSSLLASASPAAPRGAAFPAPPAATHGRGRQEKMELERAYAVRDAEANVYGYADAEVAPSYPSYPDYPEAGPSTPRHATAASASAPPLFEGFEYDWYGEEGAGPSAPPFEAEYEGPDYADAETEEQEEEREEREAETERRRDGEKGAEGGGEERREEEVAERRLGARVGRGEAHDTGWGGGGGGDGDGQAHDR